MATNVQPGAVPEMTVGGGNKNAQNKPYDSKGERDWSNGLFSCFGDIGLCVGAWCCPCIVWAKNKSRLEHLQRNGTPHPDGGDGVGAPCCMHACLSCVGYSCLLQAGTRGDIRTRYRIEGNWTGDLLTAACCTPCELIQESNELELEERTIQPQKA